LTNGLKCALGRSSKKKGIPEAGISENKLSPLPMIEALA